MTTARAFNWRIAWLCMVAIALFYVASLTLRVARHDWNITSLFCIGGQLPLPTQLANENFYIYKKWIGYDGQFALFLAYDPLLRTDIHRSFEGPAYRCQRIGLSLFAHIIVGGNRAALPYAMVGINLGVFLVGCVFFLKILQHLGAQPWWVLAYALSPGLMISEFRVLFDATSTSLMFIAMWALWKERWSLAAALLCVGSLVRETTVIFSFSVLLWMVLRRDFKNGALFLLPLIVHLAWASYVRARVGTWPVTSGMGSNLDWPMVGIVEKFLVILGKIKELDPRWPRVIPVEVIFNLGLVFALYLAVKRLDQAPRERLTLALCAYAALAIVLSSFPWSRFWHTARILDPLVLFPMLVYLQTRERRYLVPLLCATPVSISILFSSK